MKRCPQCNRVETDDALVFCRADGTALTSDSGSFSTEAGTAKLSSAPGASETETSILPPEVTDAGMSRPTGPTSVLDRQQTIGRTRELNKTKRRKAVVFAVVAVFIATIAVSAYVYLSRKNSAAINSIAVLPFQNTSGDPNLDYLSDGVTESIINSLSRVAQLKVMARSTMFRFKGRESEPQAVGKELGVSAVMTGRMLQQGDHLTVSVELVNVADGTQLWGEQYNRRASDLATVQQEIARDISERLRLRLSGEERQLNKGGTTNTEAYQSYLRGRYFWNQRTAEGIRKAIDQFQQAKDRDPNYALAYTGLSDCYILLEQYTGVPSNETTPKARAAAERALQLDDSLAEAHTSLASVYMAMWQWSKSEEEYKRAISLNPNYPTAHHWYQLLLRGEGRLDEALTEIKQAVELDPLSPILELNFAQVYFEQNDFDSALIHARRVLELNLNFALGHESFGRVYVKQGRHAEAVAEFEKDVAVDRTAYALSNLGYVYGVAGRRVEALSVVTELEEKYAKHEALGQYIAAVYVGLGDRDKAFHWLEKEFQTHGGSLPLDIVQVNGPFYSLRGDPRYTDLVARTSLKPL